MPIEEPSMTMSAAGVRPEFVSLQEAAALYSVSVDLLRQRIAIFYPPLVSPGHQGCSIKNAWP